MAAVWFVTSCVSCIASLWRQFWIVHAARISSVGMVSFVWRRFQVCMLPCVAFPIADTCMATAACCLDHRAAGDYLAILGLAAGCGHAHHTAGLGRPCQGLCCSCCT